MINTKSNLCKSNNEIFVLSKFIKKTNFDDNINNIDDLIDIINYLKSIDINSNNIHCVLKLISNLSKLTLFNSSYDHHLIFTYITHNYIIYLANIANIYISDLNSNINLIHIDDGNVISLINIYCSVKFENIDCAIKLINMYSVHKSSSYLPIFICLIKNKKYNKLKIFYEYWLEQNEKISKHNKIIKKQNYLIKQHNDKIKFIKKKYVEFRNLCNQLSDNLINDSICDFTNNLSDLTSFLSNIRSITDNKLNELIIHNEYNLIDIPNNVICDIFNLTIENNDNKFLIQIIKNINNPSDDILSILKMHFINNNFINDEFTCVLSNINNNICSHCLNKISNNAIKNFDRFDILNKISNIVISSDKIIVQTKWIEFNTLLNIHKFNIIIDGANIGYFVSKGKNELNIDVIKTIINNIQCVFSQNLSISVNILLIIHQRHMTKIKQLDYISNLFIYFTPNHLNDDWFWLYASLFHKAYVITNDQSRDHGFLISYQNEIKQWTQYYQIKINQSLGFIYPKYFNEQIIPNIYIDDNYFHIISHSKCEINIMSNCLCLLIKN